MTPGASIVCIHALLPECVRSPKSFFFGGGRQKLKYMGEEVMPFAKKLYADDIWEVLAAIHLLESVAFTLPFKD